MLKHVVFLKFKPEVAPSQVTRCFEDIGRLREVIPGIVDYSWGTDNSPEGLSQGFTHGFVMTFRDAAARDAYLPHPAHEAVKVFALPLVANIAIVDFEA